MDLSKLEIRIENTRANIEKTRRTISRHEKSLEKRKTALEARGVDLNDLDGATTKAQFSGDHETYFAICDYKHNMEDIHRNQKKLQELAAKLSDYLEKRDAEVKRNDIPVIPALEAFLDAWKKDAAEWFRTRTAVALDFRAKREAKVKEIREKYEPSPFLHRKEIDAEERAAGVDYDSYHRNLKSLFTLEILSLAAEGSPGSKAFETKLEQMLRDEVQRMRLDLYYRCTAAVGVITDASHLVLADNGSLNGIVVGESGKASVETIVAGGWNIQRRHYRVLVKPIQPSLDEQIQAAQTVRNQDAGSKDAPSLPAVENER